MNLNILSVSVDFVSVNKIQFIKEVYLWNGRSLITGLKPKTTLWKIGNNTTQTTPLRLERNLTKSLELITMGNLSSNTERKGKCYEWTSTNRQNPILHVDSRPSTTFIRASLIRFYWPFPRLGNVCLTNKHYLSLYCDLLFWLPLSRYTGSNTRH